MQRSYLLKVLLLLCSVQVSSILAAELPTGFVEIKNVIPNIKLELRYYSEDNFIGKRIDGYKEPIGIVSTRAATALKKVQDELSAFALGLKIYDSYRPQKAVDHFVRWAKDIGDVKMKSKYYPDVAKKNLIRDGYIAEKSGHSRGSTLDLTIVSLDSNSVLELDMGTRWDFFGPQSWPSSTAVTHTQRANRMLLQILMKKHGFTSMDEEWWHFTLKDEPFPNKYFNFSIQ